jgi:hypothetical protein
VLVKFHEFPPQRARISPAARQSGARTEIHFVVRIFDDWFIESIAPRTASVQRQTTAANGGARQ